MAKDTKIAWAKSTFQPWIGCVEVSPGCTHCYARDFVKNRMGYSGEPGKKPLLWGVTADRHRTSEANWRQPLTWDRAAAKTGEFWPVFCASLSDVFEDRRDLDPWRADLFRLIDATPHLTWLLLTKRPEKIADLMPPWGLPTPRPRRNVWLGTTVEDARRAEERIQPLLDVGGYVKFLSLEPQLDGLTAMQLQLEGFDWAITGGESGPKARPYLLGWARYLLTECRAFGVAPFVKQLGEEWARRVGAKSRHGADPAEWPEDIRVQEFPFGLQPGAPIPGGQGAWL